MAPTATPFSTPSTRWKRKAPPTWKRVCCSVHEQANRAYKFDGINRVILASDGVANVGNTSADGIAAQIRGYADAGIQLTTIGFGLGNYNQEGC
ncbi:MAG: hypothetical protein IPJ90_10080 [Anaerolineaceae bacterium]|nr:hypothetical protein [Anaerolineaceae bacterium]